MIKKKSIQQAVEVLRDLNKKYYEDSSKAKPLLGDEEESTLYLQVTLKKIPESDSIEMIKIPLPHPLLKDSNEVCLITGDLDKKNHKAEIEPDILHYKQLLEKHGISCISQVITLRQLRTDYKPYEAKQKLLAAYDIFLADKKIAGCLPRVLGKHFFKKRKFPIQIDLKSSNLKSQIEKALSTKIFPITGHGNSCCSEVAYLDMGDSEIIDNIMKVTKTLSEHLPGLWDNVMGIYLKTSMSKGIPLYMSYGNFNEVQIQKEITDDTIVDELSTIPNVKVKVYSDGRVVPFKEELDSGESVAESTNVDEFEQSETEANHSKGKKKKRESRGLFSDSKKGFENPEEENKIFKKIKKENNESEILSNFTVLEPKEVTEKSVVKKEKDSEQLKSLESVEQSKMSKKNKKSLKKLELSPNDSDNESAALTQSKKKIKMEKCSSITNPEQVESQHSIEQLKKSKKTKKGLDKIVLLSSYDSENESTTVTQDKKKIKMEKCSPIKDSEQVELQNSAEQPKNSKKSKKKLGKMELLPSNDSKNKNITLTQGKKKMEKCSPIEDSEEVKSQESVDMRKKSKKSKKGLENMELLFPNDSGNETITVTQNKKKIKNGKCPTFKENVNSQELVQMEEFSACNGSDDQENSTEIQSKKKKKIKYSSEKRSVEKIRSKPVKRKQTDSEMVSDLVETASNFETDQVFKKRKIDGINMKRYNARKEARKNKKKKENLPR